MSKVVLKLVFGPCDKNTTLGPTLLKLLLLRGRVHSTRVRTTRAITVRDSQSIGSKQRRLVCLGLRACRAYTPAGLLQPFLRQLCSIEVLITSYSHTFPYQEPTEDIDAAIGLWLSESTVTLRSFDEKLVRVN